MPPQSTEAAQQTGEVLAATAPTFLQPIWALSLLLVAIAVSLGVSYLARLPGLRGVRHWLLLCRAVVWAVVVFEVAFALSYAITSEYWALLGLVVIALVSVAALDWLRNIIAGLALEFERSFRPGDLVRYADTEGEIVEFSTRTVSLRADDGTLHQIPNERFTRESVTHLEADGEAACDIVVTLPRGVSPERAVRLARQAAFLTPMASPRHRPDVFLDVAGGEGRDIELHIRGYAFDPAYRAHFRSDVVARVHELLRTEQAVQG